MKIFVFVYFFLLVLTITACQPSPKEAMVPGSNTCVTDPVSCGGTQAIQGNAYQNNNNNSYGSYYPYGYGTGYGYSQPFSYYNNSAYLCNCPAGTLPTYGYQGRIGCMATASFSSTVGLSAYFYLSWGSNQWNPMPQMYHYSYGGRTCYNGAVQSCAVGQANTCAAGYSCQPQSSNSSLGLCVASYR